MHPRSSPPSVPRCSRSGWPCRAPVRAAGARAETEREPCRGASPAVRCARRASVIRPRDAPRGIPASPSIVTVEPPRTSEAGRAAAHQLRCLLTPPREPRRGCSTNACVVSARRRWSDHPARPRVAPTWPRGRAGAVAHGGVHHPRVRPSAARFRRGLLPRVACASNQPASGSATGRSRFFSQNFQRDRRPLGRPVTDSLHRSSDRYAGPIGTRR